MVKKFDKIILSMNFPEYKLQKGDIGEVIFIYNQGEELETEFRNITGELTAVIRLHPGQFQKINAVQIPRIKKFNLN